MARNAKKRINIAHIFTSHKNDYWNFGEQLPRLHTLTHTHTPSFVKTLSLHLALPVILCLPSLYEFFFHQYFRSNVTSSARPSMTTQSKDATHSSVIPAPLPPLAPSAVSFPACFLHYSVSTIRARTRFVLVHCVPMS